MAARDSALSHDADDDLDVTLIRWMLSLSPDERLAVLQGFVDSVAELTEAGRAKDLAVLPIPRRTLEETGK